MSRRAPNPVGEQLEAEIQAECVDLLGKSGYTVWEMQKGNAGNGSVYCTKGIPDLYIFRPGVAAWVELKRPFGGVVSPEQLIRHAELKHARVPFGLHTSAEQVAAHMRELRAELTGGTHG